MAVFSIKTFFQWSPLIHVVILVFGTILSFSISLARGDVSIYLPFISETGANSPQMCIFSMSLILGSFIGVLMMFCRFLLLQTSEIFTGSVVKLNLMTFFVGILAMIGLAGVAAFPMSTVYWAHLLFAALYFSGMTLYFSLVTFITFSLEGSSKLMKFRFFLNICLFILLIFLVICFPIALKRWHELNKTIPALKVPDDKGFTLVFICSLLEWSIIIIICVYALTLIIEMKNYKYIFMVSPDKLEMDADVQDYASNETNPTADSHPL